MKRKVTYFCISDVHLGHQRNTTREIVRNLHKLFDNYSSSSFLAKVDMIFIVGDLFDQLVDISGGAFYEALDFIVRLMKFCERHGIKLRVLEGTPSHDRQQNRIVETMATFFEEYSDKKCKLDAKWIKTLMIERIPELDLSILYIPDEFTPSTDTTLQIVKDLFQEQGIQKVDIAMMHGVFDYQMAGIPGNHDTHKEDEYHNLVEHFINIGHHHTFSTYMRIIAQGSTDRLAHGQEEAKGGVLMTIRDDGHDHYEFIENKTAKIFKTITLFETDLEQSLKQLDREIKKLPNESEVRIKAVKLHPVFGYLPELKKDYPFIHFTKLSFEEEKEQNFVEEKTAEFNYSTVEIRPENVVDLVMGEITTQYSLSERNEAQLRGMLAEV